MWIQGQMLGKDWMESDVTTQVEDFLEPHCIKVIIHKEHPKELAWMNSTFYYHLVQELIWKGAAYIGEPLPNLQTFT